MPLPSADQPHEIDDPWLTVAEIAEELRVNPATVRLWVSKGTPEEAADRERRTGRSPSLRRVDASDADDSADWIAGAASRPCPVPPASLPVGNHSRRQPPTRRSTRQVALLDGAARDASARCRL